MKGWERIEDERYSWLYANKYGLHSRKTRQQHIPTALLQWSGVKQEHSIIDAGCGLANINFSYPNYVGCDVSKYVIEQNRNNQEQTGEFHHCSLQEMPSILGDREFDFLLCVDVLEHVYPEKIMEALDALSRIRAKKFVLGISTRQSYYKDKDGNHLHMTVESQDTWRKLLSILFNIEREKRLTSWQRADFLCSSKNRHQ